MKILIVNESDIIGGAARSAYRLHRSLIDQDINSQMLVQHKSSNDETVMLYTSPPITHIFDTYRHNIDDLPLLFYRDRDKTCFSVSWVTSSGLVNRINALNPDIVHLHWVGLGMIKIEELAKIKQPIVWTLHDNWAFTGGCHIMWECKKYQNRCGTCPRLNSDKENDLSRKIFERKRRTYVKIKDLTVVGLSRWLMQCSQQSVLLEDRAHVNLPNPLDTTIFAPYDKKSARTQLGLPQNKKLVLFGAISATSDINKGFVKLQEALEYMQERDVELVIFGNATSTPKNDFGCRAHYLGHIHNDEELIKLYSAADVMVVPSLQENLSNAIMESMSCATPVVAFDVGGNSDLIDHEKNGYLAQLFDTDDLARGIEWVLTHERYDELCAHARNKVVENFDATIVAKKYIALYEKILSKGNDH